MTVQEIVATIPMLSFDERMTILKALAQSLGNSDVPRNRRSIPSSELRGVLKTDSLAPTDEEVKEAYTEYLMEKYK